MNEEQLIEFVNWLPTAVPEFQNASPDQIVQSLNQMAESEEGQQMLSQLFTAFQESKQAGNSQMFKKGGKMAAFVNKYGNGGCVSCKKKEILRGGMVNKIAEKMQRGGKNDKNSKIHYSTMFDAFDMDGDNLNDTLKINTIRRPISDYQHELIDQIIDSRSGNTYGVGDTIYRRRLLNGPYMVPSQNNDHFYLTPRDAAWQYGGYGSEEFEYFDTAPREWEALFKNFETPKKKKGGELATMTSAETANNIGLIPMAQNGLSLEPEVKPGGLRGLFWRPTFVPRVDASGTEMGTDWTGERATYYKPNGSLVQILTKQYAPGNTAETTRTIRYPFTPMADTTTVVRTSSDDDRRKVDNSKFNGVFSLNFDKKNK